MLDKEAALAKIDQLVNDWLGVQGQFDNPGIPISDLSDELKAHFNVCIEEAIADGATTVGHRRPLRPTEGAPGRQAGYNRIEGRSPFHRKEDSDHGGNLEDEQGYGPAR
jgi:hypothetical protein